MTTREKALRTHGVQTVNEDSCGTTVFVPAPSGRYLDEFIRLKCAPDLLTAKVFPNAKEITESMAAFRVIRQKLGAESFKDSSITLIDVASGCQPRTAALFACMTKWNTYAVDPILRQTEGWQRFRRLTGISKKIEDIEPIKCPGLAVITAVHAHVEMEKVLTAIQAPEYLIAAFPCCMPLTLPYAPTDEFKDYGIWSEKRDVIVWRIKK